MPMGRSRSRWFALGAAVSAACVAVVLAFDASAERRLRRDLQDRAEAAAYAGLQALVATRGEDAAGRRLAAIAAGERVADQIPDAHVIVTPLVSEPKVSVGLTAPAPAGVLAFLRPHRLHVVGTAGYLAPQAGSEPDGPLTNRLDWNIKTARSSP